MTATLILTGREVTELLPLADCIIAVEDAFRALSEGGVLTTVVAGVPAAGGGFHIKASGLIRSRPYFAAKVNANFPGNPARGRPTIQGVVVLCDAEQGQPLGLFDSASITSLRTAAATAVAARHLALPDARTVTLVGCGTQGRVQLRALKLVRPVEQVFVADRDSSRAACFADEMQLELGVPITQVTDLQAALWESQICVTCTTATEPLLHLDDVRPGTFIAAVGADNEHKIEVHPSLMAASRVVPDLLDQALKIGDLHHAVDAGLMKAGDVHAELAQVIAGLRPGRTDGDQVFVFDSTGTALEDVAAAALVYERATLIGAGRTIELAS
jgi:ornithine cyclodeaminase/alanine dehydrogenase-like protein (mu-crystallin family)